MIKIIISAFLLLSLNLSASQAESKFSEHKKACKAGVANECISLGILYFTGDGVEENHKKAKKAFLKPCKKRRAQACYYIGTIYKRGGFGVQRNIKKAKFYYAQACKMSHQASCNQYNLIREKREEVGEKGKNNNNNFDYTYSTEIYGG